MAVRYVGPSEYQFFMEKMSKLPFLRVSIFTALASFVFKYILLMSGISEILMLIAIITFIARIATPFLSMVENKISIVCVWCIFINVELRAILARLVPYFESNSGFVGDIFEKMLLLAVGIVGWATLAVAALALLARIFVAFFGDHY